MDLAGVRKLIVDMSGRTDLELEDSNSVVKLNHYITEAQKLLDLRYPQEKNHGVAFVNIAEGDFTFAVDYLRKPEAVYLSGASLDDKVTLKQIDNNEMRLLRKKVDPDSEETDTPYYYSLANAHPSPDFQTTSDFSAYYDAEDMLTSSIWWKTRMLLSPTADTDYTVRVEGIFWSKVMVNDTDVSIWTVKHAMLLAFQTLAVMEVALRNRQGYNDWMGYVQDEGKALWDDVVENERAPRMVG